METTVVHFGGIAVGSSDRVIRITRNAAKKLAATTKQLRVGPMCLDGDGITLSILCRTVDAELIREAYRRVFRDGCSQREFRRTHTI